MPLVNLPAGTPLLVTSELYTARSQLPVTMGTYDLKSTLELHYASPTAAPSWQADAPRRRQITSDENPIPPTPHPPRSGL